MMDEPIYLDHAAATPLDQRVFLAMEPYFSQLFYNPSSPYAPAISVRRDYNEAKAVIAKTIGAKSDELVMTAGATESINLAFGSIGGHIVTAAIEHHAVLEAAKRYDHTIVPADKRGIISADVIKKAITPKTRLVSVALANNEIGTVQPLRDIAQIIKGERERRLKEGDTTPLYLHSDASQGAGLLDIHVARLGIDLLTLNAGKIYGPKQVGLLFAASHVRLAPQIVGGGQERGLRSGTENVAGVIGFARAIQLAEAGRKTEVERLHQLRNNLEQRLITAFPDAVISGHSKRRLPGHLHISFPGIDAERLVFALEMRGILVATGSACAANNGTRSHVLTAIGLPDEVADGSLRLTLGHLSNKENTVRAADGIIEEIQREKERVAR
ncbi:MAG TPA: cysteine desulfurase family protein [Candidatus Saccharimonadales bacterium]|nr:cysteine desulfurase family protein [Candidatus Saccharimonadales bacterium]